MMKFAFLATAAAAAATAVPTASNFSSCDQAIESVLSSPDPGLKCLAPGSLNDLISLGAKNTSSADFNSSLDHWLTDFCAVGVCSSDVLNEVTANITAGCADVFNSTIFAFNPTNFSLNRDTLCLKDTVANTFCITEFFGANESVTDDQAVMLGGLSLGLDFISSGFLTSCDECGKAQYQLRVKNGNSDFSSLTTFCGANYTATLNSTPVGITQTAVDSEFKNGARVLDPTAGIVLLVVSAFYTLL
ncbi:hypothetical protein B0H13DRAFT_1889777 [Mycena leptocephala]|nr:hypothetical protein B0H13DRAFT_1889777 [Mycena leptocephala]